MKVKKEYQGLSRQELLDKVKEKGYGYLVNSLCCAPCTVAALYDLLDFDAGLVKATTALSGGTAAQVLGTCGVLSGGITVLGHYFGRPIEMMSDKEPIQTNQDANKLPIKIGGLLADRFVKEYGTFICAQMHRLFFGRFYNFRDPDEDEKFKQLGYRKKVGDVVGNGAQWVMEILLDEGAVEL